MPCSPDEFDINNYYKQYLNDYVNTNNIENLALSGWY